MLHTVYDTMTEHSSNTDHSKRARWGTKRGWQTRSAKFSPEQCQALNEMVKAIDGSVDSVVHEAVVLHLSRNGYPRQQAA